MTKIKNEAPPPSHIVVGWQPIESADKNQERLTLGIFRSGKLEEIHVGGYRHAYNDDEVSCWWSDQCEDEIAPTHWMPDLSATPAHHVRVRPLEWYQDPGSFPYKTWGAQSSFGRFIIEEVTASDCAAYEARYTPHHLITVTDGLPEAQEACQADYEARIHAALSVQEIEG